MRGSLLRETCEELGLTVFGGINAPYVWVKCPEGIGSWDMFDKMLEIARSEEDPELREHAIFWIGQSGDPRAQDVLMEVLEE